MLKCSSTPSQPYSLVTNGHEVGLPLPSGMPDLCEVGAQHIMRPGISVPEKVDSLRLPLGSFSPRWAGPHRLPS